MHKIFDNKKLVIFDMDGVIIDSIPIWTRADKELMERYGVVYDEKSFKERICGLGFDETCVVINDHYLKGLSTPEKVKEDLLSIVTELYVEVEIKDDNIIDLLKQLKARNIKTAICSANLKILAQIAVIANSLEFFFNRVITSDMVKGNHINKNEIYQTAMNELNVKAKNTVLIEDSSNAIKGAKDIGLIDTVLVYEKNNIHGDKESGSVQINKFKELL